MSLYNQDFSKHHGCIREPLFEAGSLINMITFKLINVSVELFQFPTLCQNFIQIEFQMYNNKNISQVLFTYLKEY